MLPQVQDFTVIYRDLATGKGGTTHVRCSGADTVHREFRRRSSPTALITRIYTRPESLAG